MNTGSILDGAMNYTEIDGDGRASPAFKFCTIGRQLGTALSAVGPALNTLVKLMSIIALSIGPFMTSWREWSQWYYGFIPAGLCIVGPVLISLFIWKNVEEVTARREISQA